MTSRSLLRIQIASLGISVLLACSKNQVNDVDADVAVRPNILLIVADDLGYTDIGHYGGEIQTPNIDALAANGVTFSRFYASSMCAPSRAMLLTGGDNHLVGLGTMPELLGENQEGSPGYEGYLNGHIEPLPDILLKNGYHTYMVGKWHLGYERNQSPKANGFEKSFGLLLGGASHYDIGGPTIYAPKALYRENGELVDRLPEDFYSSRFYTDQVIDYIDEDRADGKPFFAYVAYTAPHWPLHAPDAAIEKYHSVYEAGYDQIRSARFEQTKLSGLIPMQAKLPKRPDFIPEWDSLAEEEQARHARNMQVYAGMVDELDQHIGRLFAYLKAKDVFDNTLVIFISDNGADPFSLARAPDAISKHAATFDNSIENIGTASSYSFIGAHWAHVAEAPFRLYKTMSTEGGIRVPAIVSFPEGGVKTRFFHGVANITDIVPTILDIADLEHPSTVSASLAVAPSGFSLLPILRGDPDDGDDVRGNQYALGMELLGHRAIIKENWKILSLAAPAGSGQWELFDLNSDPGEQNDLSDEMPGKLAELTAEWERYQDANKVILPPPGILVHRRTPNPVN